MSDRPWLEDADPALKVERTLLKKLNGEQPPAGSVDHGWAALSAEIAGAPLLDATAGLAPAAKATAGVGIATKIAAGIAVAGGVLWGGGALLSTESASPTPSTRPSVPAEAPAERRAEPPAAVEPNDDEPLPKHAAPSGPARPATSATTLAEEGRLLARAHQLVQSGQAQQALEVLRDSQVRYPRSVLYQEREVLTIEALGATGNAGPAKQRAERFLKRYPKSAHGARLKRFVE
jgi:TolA-binding protein